MRTLIIALCLILSACDTSNHYGKCIGPFNKEDKNPKLDYEVDGWNVVLSIIFVETIIVPVVVLGYDLECPYAYKKLGDWK